MTLILVVDSDPILGAALQQEYQRQGYQVLVANTGHDALSLVERYSPDLVVLNTGLPQSSAAELYDRLKAMPGFNNTQVLFYSIRLQIEEEPFSLQQNPGDHAQGTCVLREVTLRSESLLRRVHAEPAPTLADHLIAGALILHCHNLTIEKDGHISALTPTEFDLLRYLMLHANEACSAARLLQHVWGYPPGIGSTDLVRTHMRNLRNKLGECPARPALLRTVRHRGYMLCTNGNGENAEDQWITEHATARKEPVTQRYAMDWVGARSYT